MPTCDSEWSCDVVEALRRGVTGGVVLPSDGAYAQACRVWNRGVRHRPAMIALCRNAADVACAVQTARDHGLPLSVRGGGHDWAGRALRDGGLVIDLTGMRDVAIDPRAKVATIEAGACIRDAVGTSGAHGLVSALLRAGCYDQLPPGSRRGGAGRGGCDRVRLAPSAPDGGDHCLVATGGGQRPRIRNGPTSTLR